MWRRVKVDWLRSCLPPVLLVALFVVTGLRGIDFGYHWDEVDSQFCTKRAICSPRASSSRASTSIPVSARCWCWCRRSMMGCARCGMVAMSARSSQPMLAAIDCAGLPASGAVGLPGGVRARDRLGLPRGVGADPPVVAGDAGGGALGLSWEIAYHARWLVNDCLLAQFSALCLLLLVLHHRTGTPAGFGLRLSRRGSPPAPNTQGVLLARAGDALRGAAQAGYPLAEGCQCGRRRRCSRWRATLLQRPEP